jgi:hypothetical protein
MTAKTRQPHLAIVLSLWGLVGFAVDCPAAPQPPAGQVLWDRHDGPFYSRSLLWKGADLTEENLRLLYRDLSKELKDTNTWTVDVFVDSQDAERENHGKAKTGGDYDWWLGLYNRFGRKLLPMAEISRSGQDGVLRFRDQRGTSMEVTLAGENFLRVRLEGADFEILKAYYHPLPPQTESSPGDEAMISIYVRCSSFPTAELAREFSRLIQVRFQQKRVTVAFRTDAYFLTDSAFPIAYRFDPPGAPPSRDAYERSHTMYCFCDVPGVQCR